MNRSFSLIEILVVVSIIAVLASLLLRGVSSARQKAVFAKDAQMINSLQTALELYYGSHNDWPGRASDGRMSIENKPGNQGWANFVDMLSPYIPIRLDLPYVVSGNPPYVTHGFVYMKGTESLPVMEPMYNGVTGAYVGCIKIYQGYFMDMVINDQNQFSLNDHGADPDGIDHLEGHAFVDPATPASSCLNPEIY